MALRTKVKVGNITNLSDARYCAGMGVEWLGFNPTATDRKTFKEITDWITGPTMVMELSPDDTIQHIAHFPVQMVTLSLSHLARLSDFDAYSIMLRLSLADYQTNWAQLAELKKQITWLHLDSGLTSEEQDHVWLEKAASNHHVMIGYDVNSNSIDARWRNAEAINLTATRELKPGLKDFTELADILEKLEID